MENPDGNSVLKEYSKSIQETASEKIAKLSLDHCSSLVNLLTYTSQHLLDLKRKLAEHLNANTAIMVKYSEVETDHERELLNDELIQGRLNIKSVTSEISQIEGLYTSVSQSVQPTSASSFHIGQYSCASILTSLENTTRLELQSVQKIVDHAKSENMQAQTELIDKS